tara:strand:- start:2007 stop:2279 length:273 start_codon:yes stop_codon:yes gene_type:complete
MKGRVKKSSKGNVFLNITGSLGIIVFAVLAYMHQGQEWYYHIVGTLALLMLVFWGKAIFSTAKLLFLFVTFVIALGWSLLMIRLGFQKEL